MNKIEAEIEKVIKEGKAKRTGLFVFEKIEDFKLTDSNRRLIIEILNLYKFYLESLNYLNEYKSSFLTILRTKESIRNQELENINPFIIDVLLNTKHKSATQIAINGKESQMDCSPKTICRMNKLIVSGVKGLKGDSNGDEKFRESNESFVGRRVGNILDIEYIPIDYKEIDTAINKILEFYNKDKVSNEEEIFINPILIHGLIASLQLFKDGNTRLARILQNIQLWNFSKNILLFEDLELPALYSSEAIIKTHQRKKYRELISDVAVNPNDETINNWIKFNTLMFEKQIYLNQNKVESIAKTLLR